MTDDPKLLRDYAKHGSEAAFGELAARYVDLVYSTALRQVNGDTHLAQDVTQSVFIDLARRAGVLPADIVLGGWLYRHTGFTASKVVRSEQRRRIREQEAVNMNALDTQPNADAAWRQVAPILDEAMQRLGARDRDAIVLRYFERRDLRAVGAALGTNEDAAQKRVGRALEKLRAFLARRGITFSVAVLATTIASQAVTAAPVGLATSVTGTALAGAAAGGGFALTLLKLMSMTKIKLSVISAIAVAGLATPLVIQHQSQLKLREENQSLRQRVDQLVELAAENERLSNLVVQAKKPNTPSNDQLRELARLRGEVGSLKRQLAEAAKVRDKTAQSLQEEPPVSPEAEQEKQNAILKMNNARQFVLAFHMLAGDNQKQFPTNFDQVLPYLGNIDKTPTNQFEIVYQGLLDNITNPSSIIVLREKDAWPYSSGGWNKTYGFADGHSEVHHANDSNFEEWEKEHMVQADPK